MRESRMMMGMPITIQIDDSSAGSEDLNRVFEYFDYVDKKFSTFKETSEIAKINKAQLNPPDYSNDMKIIFKLAEDTRKDTFGFFNIMTPDGKIDPSGIVKGWAINEAAKILRQNGFKEFFIDAGGDIQAEGKLWKVGIRNPIDPKEIIKTVGIKNLGIATSGNYLRGSHIWDPTHANLPAADIASMTVIGPDICEADRFATAAFAMGRRGIYFIENLPGFEGYSIGNDGVATMTAGFQKYVINDQPENKNAQSHR